MPIKTDQIIRAGLLLRPRVPTRRAALALFAAACMAVAGCQSARDRAATQAQVARDYYEAGNYGAASAAISEAIQNRDDNAEYYLLKGMIDLRAGRPVVAYNSFSRVLDLDRTNRSALAFAANIGVQIGRIKDAEDAADRLLMLDPDSLPALQVKGMVALTKGRIEDADAYAERILSQRPGDEAGTILRARSLTLNGKADEAIALVNRSLAQNGPTPAMLTNKLNIYRRMGRADEMLPIYREIVPLAGANYQFRLEQINLLYKTGHADEARRASVDLLHAGSQAVEDYGTLRRIWSQYDARPITAAGVGAVATSKDPQAIVNAVRYLILTGDTATAQRILDAVPAANAGFVASLKARLAAIEGRRDEAEAQVERILDKDANDVDALIQLAQFHFAKGEINLALNSVQKAQAADPMNPETYVVLAGIYERRGEIWRAKQIMADASRRLPQDYFIAEHHLALLRSEKEPGRAVSVATAFARAQPSATKAWDMLAAQCALTQDSECKAIVAQGTAMAKTAYMLDDPPGARANRGLFGRI